MLRTLCLPCTLLVSCSAPSLPSSPEMDLARDYITAMTSTDWDSMAPFLADDVAYQDLTMEFFERPPIDLRGRDAVVGFFKEGGEASGTDEVRTTIRDAFQAGPALFLDTETFVRASGEYWGINQPFMEVTLRQVMVLRIKDGKITHHYDVVDFGTAMQHVEEMQRRYPLDG